MNIDSLAARNIPVVNLVVFAYDNVPFILANFDAINVQKYNSFSSR
jgi:hypothetical protein